METRFRIRKVVFCLVFICLLLIGANFARAGSHPLDVLNGADVLKQGACAVEGQRFMCVMLQQGDNTYMVFIDKQGEYVVLIRKGEEWVLFWARSSI